MKIFLVIWALLMGALLQSCDTRETNSPQVYDVSMIQLLANPEKWNGKEVAVIGYYHSRNPESTGIFLTRDDARIYNIRNGVAIAGYADGRIVSAKSLPANDRFVSIVGSFVGGPTGHMGLWPGMIYPVTGTSIFNEESGKWVDEIFNERQE